MKGEATQIPGGIRFLSRLVVIRYQSVATHRDSGKPKGKPTWRERADSAPLASVALDTDFGSTCIDLVHCVHAPCFFLGKSLLQGFERLGFGGVFVWFCPYKGRYPRPVSAYGGPCSSSVRRIKWLKELKRSRTCHSKR